MGLIEASFLEMLTQFLFKVHEIKLEYKNVGKLA